MLQIYKNFWRNYFNFSGVSSRKEFWVSILINFILYFVVSFIFAEIGAVLSNVNENTAVTVTAVGTLGFDLAIIIPSLSILVRRFHDVNKSGWWALASFVPILNIIAFVYTLTSSDHVNNKWVVSEVKAEEA